MTLVFLSKRKARSPFCKANQAFLLTQDTGLNPAGEEVCSLSYLCSSRYSSMRGPPTYTRSSSQSQRLSLIALAISLVVNSTQERELGKGVRKGTACQTIRRQGGLSPKLFLSPRATLDLNVVTSYLRGRLPRRTVRSTWCNLLVVTPI